MFGPLHGSIEGAEIFAALPLQILGGGRLVIARKPATARQIAMARFEDGHEFFRAIEAVAAEADYQVAASGVTLGNEGEGCSRAGNEFKGNRSIVVEAIDKGDGAAGGVVIVGKKNIPGAIAPIQAPGEQVNFAAHAVAEAVNGEAAAECEAIEAIFKAVEGIAGNAAVLEIVEVGRGHDEIASATELFEKPAVT